MWSSTGMASAGPTYRRTALKMGWGASGALRALRRRAAKLSDGRATVRGRPVDVVNALSRQRALIWVSFAAFAGGWGSRARGRLRCHIGQFRRHQVWTRRRTPVSFRISVHVEHGLRPGRRLHAMAALCLLASGLIALRYGLSHGLDLHAPITQFLLEDQAIHEAKRRRSPPRGRRNHGWRRRNRFSRR